MPGLLRGVVRTAAIAGTATAVSNNVSRRQAGRWAAQNQSAAERASAVQTQAAVPQAAPQAAPQAPQAPQAPATVNMDERIAQLNQLAALRDQGILTDAEFAAQKALILNI